ncbi:hypothetical protein ANN_27566 [Periplaneta americana]|uniref:Uncharacterized protein n=1 Tax=Periplaneta americana TaxID=6978 RepID=A0ABQ8RWL5_PERAM|nr:hypothetical protein ANN_27566 [Periplaneta americana]
MYRHRPNVKYKKGFVKDKVYSTPVENLNHLRRKIYQAIANITPQMLQNTWMEVEYNLNMEIFLLVTIPDSPQSCVELNLECDMVEEQHEVMQDRVAVKRKLTVTREEDELNEIEALKKRKLELEIRRLELEVWEKENALHVKHSYLTNDIEEIGDGQ